MGNFIKIKLVPNKKDKIYKPLPGYADLYILMNKLHLHSVNAAIEEEIRTVSELESLQYQTQEQIQKNNYEESTLNVLANCLESLIKSIKKDRANAKIPDIKEYEIEDFNNITEESDLVIKDNLAALDFKLFKEHPDKFLSKIEANLKLINNRKALIISNNNNLMYYISKLDTLKENINSSKADIDSLEIALKNLKFPD